jgi:hypothetical protein
VLALAIGAESVALLVTPGAPPIYDGIGYPDEPYRFVQPPVDYRETKPPTTTSRQLPVSGGRTGSAVTMNSAESGPQVQLYIPEHGIEVSSPDARRVTVVVAPVTPPELAVPGHPWSNVYRLTVTADVGSAELVAGKPGQMLLRAPTPEQPGPDFYADRDGTWSRLTTHRTGNDVYEAEVRGSGYYVLAADRAFDLTAKDPNSEGNVGIIGFVIAGLGVAAAIILFVRGERRRSRRRTKVSGNATEARELR